MEEKESDLNAKLKESVKNLLLEVKLVIDKKFENNEIKLYKRNYFRWKIDNFLYTRKGVENKLQTGEYFTKEDWSYFPESSYFLANSDNYIFLLDKLSNHSVEEDKKISFNLINLLNKFSTKYLQNNRKINLEEIEEISTIFIKELNNEPVYFWAKVELSGVILVSDNIELSPEVNLRKVNKDDLEVELPTELLHFNFNGLTSQYDAILRIKKLATSEREVQDSIEKTICILRLFKPGSIHALSYTFGSESIIKFLGERMRKSNHLLNSHKYIIEDFEEKHLKSFFNLMNEYLSRSFFITDQSKIDFVTIAYQRYCDSLLENKVIEKRIADIIMGFEALFSTDGKELTYRLSLRIAKFFNHIGFNSIEIKKQIEEAYKIRSIYAHGEILDYKSRTKFESKCGDLNLFLNKLLNYLRLSILFCLLINFDKHKLVETIDLSLIDKEKENILISQLEKWKSYLISN